VVYRHGNFRAVWKPENYIFGWYSFWVGLQLTFYVESYINGIRIFWYQNKQEEVKMKKLSMILPLALILCLMVGCQDKEAMAELEALKAQAEVEEQNKEIVRRTHAEVWSNGNMDVIDELYDNSYLAHWTSGPDTQGLDELREVINEARTAFPDLTENIEQIVAEGDLVVTRFSSSGTFKGNIMGISPKDKKVTRQEIAIHRIDNGKIVEQWTVADSLVLMQQLGMELKPKEEE
jgi:steroid delta-isomerase-like uncharacterized protein